MKKRLTKRVSLDTHGLCKVYGRKRIVVQNYQENLQYCKYFKQMKYMIIY